jgi:small subunit ribosomal protein S16
VRSRAAGRSYLLTLSLKIGKLSYVVITYQELQLLVIRLARTGRAKYPTYRVVAAESARAATGKFVAVLGHYNPHTKELVIKKDEVKKHLSNGAQPSNTVVKLLMRQKVELPAWVKLKTKAPKPKDEPNAEAKAPEAGTEAADGESTEAPVEAAAEVRVAEVAEEAAASAEANQTSVDHTATAADEK